MPSLWVLIVSASIFAYSVNWYLGFARNLRAAKASGIPYVIVPVYVFNRAWLITHRIWLPWLAKLPQTWTRSWIDFLSPDFAWEHHYEPFKRLGTDTFLTVSPGSNALWTADPDVIFQIANRRNDFPKPIHIYSSVDIYGKNVVSTEGNAWRHQRRLTSPPFTEKNNHLVWSETLGQGQAMLKSWVGQDGRGNKTVQRLMDDTMRLSLHVISRAGFGVKLEWPTDADGTGTGSNDDPDYVDPSKIKNEAASKGHSMSYTYSIHCLLDNIILVMMLPDWLLKYSPLKVMRRAREAYHEWGQYMQDMVNQKRAQVQSGHDSDTKMDLLGALVKAQQSDDKSSGPILTESEILGNSFVFILAGHETAANSIHFSILYLALKQASQRHLQEDLDSIFQGRPCSEWDYDLDLPKLFGGMTGAVMNEELRLVAPVVCIPKMTMEQPQVLSIDGKKCTVPAWTYVNLDAAGVHRNPNHWPNGPPSDKSNPAHRSSNLDNDLEEFKPERWLVDGKALQHGSMPSDDQKTADTDDLGVNTAADTAASLYRPVKGSYIPFSEGYRACIGRRFAQVEILAVLAVIFSQYSVELAVDEWASDEEVAKMSKAERKVVWNKAAKRAQWLMQEGMGAIITLQMRAGHVPVRLVRKGEERFIF